MTDKIVPFKEIYASVWGEDLDVNNAQVNVISYTDAVRIEQNEHKQQEATND